MTSKQTAKHSMYITVDEYLTIYLEVVGRLLNLSESLNELRSYVTGIEELSSQHVFSKTGISAVKRSQKNALAKMLANLIIRLRAFAKLENNQVLRDELKHSESTLKVMPDTTLYGYAQGIYSRIDENIRVLDTYGITAESQAALQQAMRSFFSSIPKPRLSIADKKQITVDLARYFDNADAILANIDTVMKTMKEVNPKVYNGYVSSRKVVHTGSTPLTLRGIVTDSATGEPVKGVLLSFSAIADDTTLNTSTNALIASKEEVLLTKRTADKGGFNIKSLPEGIYSVNVKKNGYKPQVLTLAVNDGELNELNIEIVKN